MRVLVTGARGFVGSHTLQPLVEAGFEVHALSRRVGDPAAHAVTWHQGDLLTPGFAAAFVRGLQPTHLLHLAWETTHPTYWTSPANVQWVEASIALSRAFLEHGGTRIVAAGTCAEYDWREGGVCDEETTPLRPATLYGVAKLQFAEALRTLCIEHHAGFAWARFFFVYGPGEQPERLLPSVTGALRRGEVARCTSGQQRRDFIYVRDCASALVMLLLASASGTFNVGTGSAPSVRDVVTTIATVLDAADRVALGTLPERPDDPQLIVADIRRMQALGWSPAYDLRAGIEETIRGSAGRG